MNTKIKVSIVGASGYTGGELLRILLFHPNVILKQVTSREHKGDPVCFLHPNLRTFASDLYFSCVEDLKPCDLIFICLPNGKSMHLMEGLQSIATNIIDLGADFRLPSPSLWEQWYGCPHTASHLLGRFVYGLPEINKERIKKAQFVAGPGCEAAVTILSLWPLVKEGLIEGTVIVEAKIGSSAAGSSPSHATHHAERSRVVRSYMPTGHRHTVEVEEALKINGNLSQVFISATAVEIVRGVAVTAHAFSKSEIDERDIWRAYLREYKDDPFIRIVKERRGLYRYPEPKILQGTNFCELGFEKDRCGNRVVLLGAIDNLVKGAAGNAVQCMNLMFGFAETAGLEFPGLHPV